MLWAGQGEGREACRKAHGRAPAAGALRWTSERRPIRGRRRGPVFRSAPSRWTLQESDRQRRLPTNRIQLEQGNEFPRRAGRHIAALASSDGNISGAGIKIDDRPEQKRFAGCRWAHERQTFSGGNIET